MKVLQIFTTSSFLAFPSIQLRKVGLRKKDIEWIKKKLGTPIPSWIDEPEFFKTEGIVTLEELFYNPPEVYSLSSLFTAIVFWAVLKWENVADEPYANRWLILIAYFMGLSIGVHLLNLLAIPAIAFVYYFRKYNVTRNGIIKASIITMKL